MKVDFRRLFENTDGPHLSTIISIPVSVAFSVGWVTGFRRPIGNDATLSYHVEKGQLVVLVNFHVPEITDWLKSVT